MVTVSIIVHKNKNEYKTVKEHRFIKIKYFQTQYSCENIKLNFKPNQAHENNETIKKTEGLRFQLLFRPAK